MEYAELFALRLKRRVSSSDKPAMAKELGVSMSALNNYLAGRSLPSVDVAVSLAKLCGLGAHLQWLFGDMSDSVEPPIDDQQLPRDALGNCTVDELTGELGKRYWPLAVRFDQEFEWYMNADWLAIGRAAISLVHDRPISEADRAELDRFEKFQKHWLAISSFSIMDEALDWEMGNDPVNPRVFESPDEYERRLTERPFNTPVGEIPDLIESIQMELPKAQRDPLEGNRSFWRKGVLETARHLEEQLEKFQDKPQDPDD